MRVSDVPLVFEGGGTRNSYTTPFVELLLREGIDVSWVGGVSVGAMPLDYETFNNNLTPDRISAVRAETGETINWGQTISQIYLR